MHARALRWLIFIGLAAFVPLFYYLGVVAGWLPYGAILLITIRNLRDAPILGFGIVHLALYGVVLFWLARLIEKLIERYARRNVGLATLGLLALLAGIGAIPTFGIGHGQIRWESAYQLYASRGLR